MSPSTLNEINATAGASGSDSFDGDEMRARGLFPKLTEYDIECVLQSGTIIDLEPGDVAFTEGEPASHFFVILEGELQVTKLIGGHDNVITSHRMHEFTGEISLLTGGKNIATGRAVGQTKVVKLDNAQLREVLLRCPELSETVIRSFAKRNFEVAGLLQQQEKLAALGKLSAGLAHELNNPAAAASRALTNLKESFREVRDRTFQMNLGNLGPGAAECLRNHADHAAETAEKGLGLTAMQRSDREEELADWLTDHNLPEPYDLASRLVSAGYTVPQLDELAANLSGDSLKGALCWISSTIETTLLVSELSNSVHRISDLVRAVKSYSYMDRTPFQESDLRTGLEDTLLILSNKVKRFTIVKDFDDKLPPVCSYAAEMNQVWTNLIDNACDAMGDHGTLTLRTRKDGKYAIVEIGDTGPGIPPEVQPHIFEAFFTTKPQGEGTGLGLDIAYRIVTVRHQGTLKFKTSPQGTTFTIRLLINQAEPKQEDLRQLDRS
jgi:signal transduction histidine kinase